MNPKVGSLKRSTKLTNLWLDGLRNESENIQITTIRNESRNITNDSIEIKRGNRREHYEQLYAQNWIAYMN